MPCRQTSEHFGPFLRKQPEAARTQLAVYASRRRRAVAREIRGAPLPLGLRWTKLDRVAVSLDRAEQAGDACPGRGAIHLGELRLRSLAQAE